MATARFATCALLLALGAAIGFNRTREYLHPPRAAPVETAACAVYRAVLREYQDSGAVPVLNDSTRALEPQQGMGGPIRAAASPALRESFAAENAAPAPLDACPEIPAHRVPAAEMRAIAQEHGAGDGHWREFRRRYPSSSGYFQLSRPGFSPDGRQALVFVQHHCGGHCGTWSYLVLRRAGAGWRVEERVVAAEF